MEADAGAPISELRVDGGAVANDLLMQIQADLLGIDVVRPKVIETTALGAAYLAGLAVGYWSSIEQLAEQWQPDRHFRTALAPHDAQQRLRGWHRAVEAAKVWADSE